MVIFIKFYFLEEFIFYFKYVRELQFDEKPDYQYLRDLFKKLLSRNDLYNDFVFDWCIPKVIYINNLFLER